MSSYHLAASPETCHWGVFAADLAPVLRVASGDRVTIDTVSGSPEVLPPEGFHVPSELLDIHARSVRNVPGHILTGPVAVEGAVPGDVLEVRIVDVQLRQDWGYNVIRPLSGTIPEDFDVYRHITIPLDAKRNMAKMSWGVELPLSPFFGIMGVAPPPQWGRINTIVPRAHGGNLDNKELPPGRNAMAAKRARQGRAILLRRRRSRGAGRRQRSATDGDRNRHAGGPSSLIGCTRICISPLSRARKRRQHTITMGMHPDLDQCLNMALRHADRLAGEKGRLSAQDAYTLCSLAADFRVTQTVNGSRGVHAMLAKNLVRAG